MAVSMQGGGRSRGGRHARRKPMAEINVTPMVDVMLVLLIIFMVAAPLLSSASSIKVNLPKAATAETTAASPLSLTLARQPSGEPRLYANGQQTDEAGVRRLVGQLIKQDRDLQAIVSRLGCRWYRRDVGVGSPLKLADLHTESAGLKPGTIRQCDLADHAAHGFLFEGLLADIGW